MKAYAQMMKKERGNYICVQLINEKGETVQLIKNFLTVPLSFPCVKDTSVFKDRDAYIYFGE